MKKLITLVLVVVLVLFPPAQLHPQKRLRQKRPTAPEATDVPEQPRSGGETDYCRVPAGAG